MPPEIRELKSMLRKAGFVSEPGKGSHTKWTHPHYRAVHVTLSGQDGEDAQPYQIREVREALQDARTSEREQP
jgi:predicted RNA binding protein YcfA (HicA-like mRNA interferase family)